MPWPFSRRSQSHGDVSAQIQAEVARQLGDATQALKSALSELRQRQGDLRRDMRVVQGALRHDTQYPWPLDPGATDHVRVAAHVANAIGSAQIETSPTPHLVTGPLLPEDTYQALLDSLPPDELYSERDPIKLNFRPALNRIMPTRTAQMWNLIEGYVIPRLLVPAIFGQFREHIARVYAERYGDKAGAVTALPHEASAGRLMLRRPGYHLDPHVDPRRVIVTCLLYVAQPEDDTSFGTQFFSLNAVPEITKTKTFYPANEGYTSTLVKTVPFTANTLVAFLNAGAAAHGADIPASAPAETRRHAYQFYISPVGLEALTGEAADGAED